MNATLTSDGGLILGVESDFDWVILDAIAGKDAGGMASAEHLADSLGLLMDEESEWGEWVVPELADGFNAQQTYVQSAVAQARQAEEPQIKITAEDADFWYGAINQYRLALQRRYRFDAISPDDESSEEVQEAYMKDRFFTSLQSILLEHVML